MTVSRVDNRGQNQRQRPDKDLEILKIQVDDIILPWVADGFLCIGGFLCLNPPWWQCTTLFLEMKGFLLLYKAYKFKGGWQLRFFPFLSGYMTLQKIIQQ